ncbi:Mis12-Mtw1 protein family-domain-containing protein [Mycena maculata]|uniref:Mis12-Mtw1 protein family-domain-containing protein n=1 Tax=Mycena maculata TaxID=230809 RepID=A0AAD7HVF2_9AGAR|nr:Mis12-Mtw1 protein family-domain-containing protein [Mycena maculata]
MEAHWQANPLLAVAAAAKKTKAKRKYTEDTLLGRDSARPPSAGPSNPPAKKFKADVPRGRSRNASVDPALEQEVLDMEDKTARLRASRAQTTGESSIAFRSSPEKQPRPRSANSKSKKQQPVVDMEEPLRDGTPQAVRNKLLRGDAMAAIARDASRARTPESDPKGHRRRSSLGGRGHRISDSFQDGAYALPHPKVDELSFYKHVDRDVPPADQVRQLIVWSASRAGPPRANLPPEDLAGLKTITDGMMRWVAERRLDVSMFQSDDKDMDDGVKGKNAQNEKNTRWVGVYSKEIEDAETEAEEWKRIQFHYDAYGETAKKHFEERSRARAEKRAQPIDERFLDERFRRGLELARALPNPAAQLRDAARDLQPTLDALHTDLHTTRTAVRVARRVLDVRFNLLGAGLDARAGTGASGGGGSDVRGLLKALARVDAERPPERVGDEVRQAAREVQRAVRAGEGERRVTLTGAVPGAASGSTPRRPGTPRRERTPGKDRTPARERTPVR